MNDLKYDFSVVDVENEISFVSEAQILVFRTKQEKTIIQVYFMINSAYEITAGIAKSSLGKIRLWYVASSPSGAVAASIKLAKIQFTFPQSEGLAQNFQFLGEKI